MTLYYQNNSNEFWKSWRNTFGGNRVCPNQVDDTPDVKEIVSKFADYFKTCFIANCAICHTNLRHYYKNGAIISAALAVKHNRLMLM